MSQLLEPGVQFNRLTKILTENPSKRYNTKFKENFLILEGVREEFRDPTELGPWILEADLFRVTVFKRA